MSTKAIPPGLARLFATRRQGGAWAGALLAVLVILPLVVPNAYWTVIATQVVIFWILVTGLNLVVGYAGQLSVGHVGLLAVGAYAACTVSENFGVGAFAAVAVAAVVGLLAGLLIGLPALRLRRFYFAMLTLAFATIVAQLAVVWRPITGGGTGIEAPVFPAPFDIPGGFYWMCLAFAALATYLTWCYAGTNNGRALVAIRDAEVAAESLGVRVFRLKLVTFGFSGLLAGVSGALYASVQTYVTPEAFNFDLSMLFFTCVLLGGRGRVFAPFAATVVLVMLPELVDSLEEYAAFFYAALLLLVVLLLPNGVGGLLDRFRERFMEAAPADPIAQPRGVGGLWDEGRDHAETLSVTAAVKEFGGVRALGGVDLTLRPGTVHGLIGPNGSGKTTLLNTLSGFHVLDSGSVRIGDREITRWSPQQRAREGIARCFQTPRLPGALTALDNVKLGGYRTAETTSVESFTGLGRVRAREAKLDKAARAALHAVGLEHVADITTEQVQHSRQRFLEIARCLVEKPRFLLLDEPAAGLSKDEIDKLRDLIKSIAAAGTGVLLVEHHTDLVFACCDELTVLNFGAVLRQGSPEDVRADTKVVNAYLGV
ncbi:branched-chain amino acid ABC transporter ATP-binding protein/permease [Mycobacterium sp. NPDC003449]